jgi:hypothetical protein
LGAGQRLNENAVGTEESVERGKTHRTPFHSGI